LLTSRAVPEMYFPAFSADGRWVLFTGGPDEKGRYNIFRVRADGGAPPERLTEADESHGTPALSPDGTVLLLNVAEGNEYHVWEKRLSPAGPLRPLVRTPGVAFEGNARFSPDGAWVAYMSSAGGINEIWVRAYAVDGARHQVSTDGGKGPIWHPRRNELFYQGPRGMMSVAFVNGRPGVPVQLFPMEATGPPPGMTSARTGNGS
jgi:Tol biopolymer transport system component